ncbi:MAG: type 1 glutamine amidotransferase [Terriglobia bacterium]
MKILILQHIACEPAGIYEDILAEKGASIHRVEIDAGQQLPDWRGVDAIVAMGGPMSVNDDDTLSWLTTEKRWVREAVLAGRPFWGVCLGAQLLAASLGARVYSGARPEIGIMPVYLTVEGQQDTVFSGIPPKLLTFQWHGETFDVPEGAVLLASSPAYPNQAFRWKEKAYGVQFHVEVSADMAEQWAQVPDYAAALGRVLGAGAARKVVGDVLHEQETLHSYARRMFENWLKACCGEVKTRFVPGTSL